MSMSLSPEATWTTDTICQKNNRTPRDVGGGFWLLAIFHPNNPKGIISPTSRNTLGKEIPKMQSPTDIG
jgi:hypothetical protein